MEYFFLSMPHAASIMAVSCGTPAPATILVVQIEPGPIPTFTASAPASANAFAPAAVPTFPAMTFIFLKFFFTFFNASDHAFAVTMRTVQCNHINPDILQCGYTVKNIFCNANTCANQQSSEFIFHCIGKTFNLQNIAVRN